MGKFRSSNITAAIGVKGAGKTALTSLLFQKRPRAFVIDPMGEYEGGCICSGHLETLEYLLGTAKFRIIYRPLEEADFLFACKTVAKTKNCLLVVEELGRYCDTHTIPPEFDEIVARGRHLGVDLAYTVQRFQMIHRNITALTDEFYIFRQFEAVDVEEIDRRFGEHVAAVVRELEDLEAVHIKVKEFRAYDPTSFTLVSVCRGVGVFDNRRAPAVASARG